jgi:uncharacterized SAM-dependent methyltransferase
MERDSERLQVAAISDRNFISATGTPRSGPGTRLLIFTAATRTSAKTEKLHRSRDFLNRQADVLNPDNALVLGLDNLTRRTGTHKAYGNSGVIP